MTFVLVHPIGMDPGCWRFCDLPGAVPVVLAGHGDRGYPGRPLSLDDLADDLVGQLPPGRVDLVGLAFGGCVAQHVALRHPDRLRSLVLAHTTGSTVPEVMRGRAAAARERGLAQVLPETFARWFTPQALARPDHPGVGYARTRFLANDVRSYADCWDAMAGHDVLPRLGELAVPVTLLAGTRDLSATVEKVRAIHQRVPTARFELLDGPHMIHLEAPAVFSAAVHRHLAAVAAAS
ncbi:alpha/beta fold hydrolase [Micromonospora sp. WMMD1082]|uniref:alpha/beta fold hydrolase n=1 Tax=Micromonospora sp. WMMD1082 TaxID=3016104 RepID=UPI0024160B6B|nr:alpha/beta fold hydrolase [Micromonospora sp. WMMD1082]MDG4798358.1 hypothetical protein [Micromonospora sp. WMMD1082]